MEFREMRRNKQQISKDECIDILERNTSGVLAVLGDNDYPYAVPLSYVYYDNNLYFHCAKSGHKLDAVKKYDKVSFCVIDQDLVVPQEYTTYFRSVIVFGRAKVVDQQDEMYNAIKKLAIKYNPDDSEDNLDAVIKREYSAMCMVKIEVEHITGKEAIELVRKKHSQETGQAD